MEISTGSELKHCTDEMFVINMVSPDYHFENSDVKVLPCSTYHISITNNSRDNFTCTAGTAIFPN